MYFSGFETAIGSKFPSDNETLTLVTVSPYFTIVIEADDKMYNHVICIHPWLFLAFFMRPDAPVPSLYEIITPDGSFLSLI